MRAAQLLSPEHVCLPCYQGEHVHCRHRPDGPRFSSAPKGAPCQCEKGGHVLGRGTCSYWRQGEWGDGRRCGRPTKETVQVTSTFIGLRGSVEVERCAIHLAALRRVRANDAKRAEARRLEEAEEERSDQNRRAAKDAVRELTALGHRANVAAGEYAHCDGSLSMQAEDLLAMARELDDLRKFVAS